MVQDFFHQHYGVCFVGNLVVVLFVWDYGWLKMLRIPLDPTF